MMNKHAFYVIKQESQRRLLLTSEIMPVSSIRFYISFLTS